MVLRIAILTDNADYDAGETSGNRTECITAAEGHLDIVDPYQRIQTREFPVVHPPCDAPLCKRCRIHDIAKTFCCAPEEHNLVKNGQDDGAEEIELAYLSSRTPVDDDPALAWEASHPAGSWWCDQCQEAVVTPGVSVPELFAVLRQWTPHAQLQLATVVEEILRRGANIDDRDGVTDMTLLHFAAKSGALGDEEIACK
ncbi:unnamed protein product [Protopolystoma xenopodis]|uniref:Uncharacterized protein n=1 Tax=Protopolystoma xenopodis TaxID=117903 RepID=A0A3S5A588_9PLAT|nr:unnamed protein product [Protopolystoma xenopodis]